VIYFYYQEIIIKCIVKKKKKKIQFYVCILTDKLLEDEISQEKVYTFIVLYLFFVYIFQMLKLHI